MWNFAGLTASLLRSVVPYSVCRLPPRVYMFVCVCVCVCVCVSDLRQQATPSRMLPLGAVCEQKSLDECVSKRRLITELCEQERLDESVHLNSSGDTSVSP